MMGELPWHGIAPGPRGQRRLLRQGKRGIATGEVEGAPNELGRRRTRRISSESASSRAFHKLLADAVAIVEHGFHLPSGTRYERPPESIRIKARRVCERKCLILVLDLHLILAIHGVENLYGGYIAGVLLDHCLYSF
jgi:hypothetical protein